MKNTRRAIKLIVLVAVVIAMVQFCKIRVGKNSFSTDSKNMTWSTESTESLWDFTTSYNFVLTVTRTFNEHNKGSNYHVKDAHDDQTDFPVHVVDLVHLHYAKNFTQGNTKTSEVEKSVYRRRKFTPSQETVSSRPEERTNVHVTTSNPTSPTHEMSNFVNDDVNTLVKPVDQNPASQKHLTALYEESKDVFDLLPDEYLPDYMSFCWYDSRDEFQCLASVYLAGMPKCGTTDLFDKLMWHPELTTQSHHLAGNCEKEYHYWTRGRVGRPRNFLLAPRVPPPKTPFSDFLTGTGAERVKNNKEMRIVDGTPSLLWDLGGWETRYPDFEEAPYSNGDLIHAVTPDAKILAILRNPVDRLYSEYLYFWKGSARMKNEARSPQTFHLDVVRESRKFNRCIESKSLRYCCYSSDHSIRLRVALGVYVCYIRDFLEVFGDNLLVVTMNEYHSYPVETLTKIFNHIGVSKPNLEDLRYHLATAETLNEKNDIRKEVGEMLEETRELLNGFYGPYNSELVTLLDDSKYLFV